MSESEGEFRKRLSEPIPNDQGGQVALDRLRTLGFLDEARKEFPTNEDAILRAKTEGGNLSADNIERCRSFLAQIWFKRWFGEPAREDAKDSQASE